MPHYAYSLPAITLALTALIPTTSHADDTTLVCDTKVTTTMLRSYEGRIDTRTFVIRKNKNQVQSVKSEHQTYGLERVDINIGTGKPPLYAILLVEDDRVVLRYEFPEEKRNADIILYASGKFEMNTLAFSSEGFCKVTQRLF